MKKDIKISQNMKKEIFVVIFKKKNHDNWSKNKKVIQSQKMS